MACPGHFRDGWVTRHPVHTNTPTELPLISPNGSWQPRHTTSWTLITWGLVNNLCGLNVLRVNISGLIIRHPVCRTRCLMLSSEGFFFLFFFLFSSACVYMKDLFNSVTPSTILLYVKAIGLFSRCDLKSYLGLCIHLTITFF